MKKRSLWGEALWRLTENRLAVISFGIIVFYALIASAAALGLIASPWETEVGGSYQAPSSSAFKLWLGTDIFGRSVLYKVIHGARMALGVGLVASLISVPLGIVLGALAGYFGKWVDHLIVWFYTTLSSIPNIMLVIAITYVLGKGFGAMYIALGITSWVGLARVIRGEVLKHKQRDYVLAAESLGCSHFSRIFRHIVPNIVHFGIISFSIQFMTAIKTEVILSFLGLGAQGQPSWGIMIDDAKQELFQGVWWQLAGATVAMLFVVLAFNILGDALRDALDPRAGRGIG
ncbi:MAG TPA: ABC transporter permease [Bdellovibrionales bacterium]|nr:MAG: peptide ABC transporter permease [Bdellovibrionales bacterium GWB1_52_6]OFZ05014.1 MAG: peptide ABC transporter permease [Bdellovibrionales bacterium GWA1_52_35]HAR41999.1 ABC transporter permease [Bdellovibrionales bacterium]HCM41247.1 ABC transporter permease [Bdellovibrionales bacterium]